MISCGSWTPAGKCARFNGIMALFSLLPVLNPSFDSSILNFLGILEPGCKMFICDKRFMAFKACCGFSYSTNEYPLFLPTWSNPSLTSSTFPVPQTTALRFSSSHSKGSPPMYTIADCPGTPPFLLIVFVECCS